MRATATVVSINGGLPIELGEAQVGDAVEIHISIPNPPVGNGPIWDYDVDVAASWIQIGTERHDFNPADGSAIFEHTNDYFSYIDNAVVGDRLEFPGGNYSCDLRVLETDNFFTTGDLALLASQSPFFPQPFEGIDTIKVYLGSGFDQVVLEAHVDTLTYNVSGIFDVCQSLPNVSGNTASLNASSHGSAVGSGLHLECSGGPPNEFGFFFVGPGHGPELTVFEGIHCLAQPTGRYNPVIAGNQGLPQLSSVGQFDAGGVLQNLSGTSLTGSGFDVPLELPYAPIGQVIAPGDSWYFQLWYRDVDSNGGSSANFSNAIEATFE